MGKSVLTICVGGILIGLCCLGNVEAQEESSIVERNPVIDMPVPVKKPLIQMAILLDTSGSMSGLIDQAKAELWAIVNEFIFARRQGQEPELQVALFEYGKSSLARKDGYIRQIVALTTDLDKISEELFALKTNGGDEYCGWVIREATKLLEWSSSPDDLKVIFIAGNEPFTQGPIDYRKSCKEAVSKGIIVNTIHCGSQQEGINGKWKDGCLLADGQYLNIDHNRRTVHIEAPQDKEIAELSRKLNDTYVAYGRHGGQALGRQAAQDKNAARVSGEVAAQRAMSKSSHYYNNSGWDLVDAFDEDESKLEKLKAEDLPEPMKKMSKKERKAYIEVKAKERGEVQKRIQELTEQRKKHVAQEMKKLNKDGKTLGSAIIKAIRKQAEMRNFKFESAEKNSEKDASK